MGDGEIVPTEPACSAFGLGGVSVALNLRLQVVQELLQDTEF